MRNAITNAVEEDLFSAKSSGTMISPPVDAALSIFKDARTEHRTPPPRRVFDQTTVASSERGQQISPVRCPKWNRGIAART